LDTTEDPHIRLNFNITMLDLKCDWAVVDVVSSLGSNQNVTAHVTKWDLDANGIRQHFRGRNKLQDDIELFDESVTESLEELHGNGEDAVSLDEQTLTFAKNENEFLFVDFYASWCSHCRDLAPTWEALAEIMVDTGEHLGKLHHEDYESEDYDAATKIEQPVVVGKIDCVTHAKVCRDHGIRAYPTLRLFYNGQPWKGGDYKGHRTLISIIEWLYFVEEKAIEMEGGDKEDQVLQHAHRGTTIDTMHTKNHPNAITPHLIDSLRLKILLLAAHERLLGDDVSDEERQWHEKMLQDRKRLHDKERKDSEHPGCQLSGHL
jgi:thiol-disulfide isomerase/thioredoxin